MNQALKAKHPNLHITEGKWGGTYGQVRADTVGGEVHHVPADEVSPTSMRRETAIWMETAHHIRTKSNGRTAGSKDYRKDLQRLVDQGDTLGAIRKDVQDVQRIAPHLYDIPILQMLKTYSRNKRNGKPSSK